MAASFESVHLPHFEGPAGEVPRTIARLAEFFGDLARFASVTESGRVRRTPIRCRKRPGHKPCRGLLLVRRSDLPAAVEWECPVCSAAGRISGWEGSTADLRRSGLPDASDRRVRVSVAAHADLRDLARTDRSLIPLAYGAEVEGAQPILLVNGADRDRYGSVLQLHAMKESSQERAERLGGIVAALAEIGEDRSSASGFAELDAVAAEDFVAAVLALKDVRPPEFVPARPRPRPRSTRRRATGPETFRLKVTLRDVRPPVWRRLLVPSDISLPALHDVLQTAMGWYDCHLHMFRSGERAFAPPGDFEPIGEDSHGVSLCEIAPGKGSRAVYEYDFGDGWCHDVVVEEVIEGRCPSVRCLTGRRSCPPEDCGGPWGYAQLREVIADPTHERYAEIREWLPDDFDPEKFDVLETDAMVREVRI